MTLIEQYGLFLLKMLTVVFGFIIILAGVVAIARKAKNTLEITNLNKKHQDTQTQMNHAIKHKKINKKREMGCVEKI